MQPCNTRPGQSLSDASWLNFPRVKGQWANLGAQTGRQAKRSHVLYFVTCSVLGAHSPLGGSPRSLSHKRSYHPPLRALGNQQARFTLHSAPSAAVPHGA